MLATILLGFTSLVVDLLCDGHEVIVNFAGFFLLIFLHHPPSTIARFRILGSRPVIPWYHFMIFNIYDWIAIDFERDATQPVRRSAPSPLVKLGEPCILRTRTLRNSGGSVACAVSRRAPGPQAILLLLLHHQGFATQNCKVATSKAIGDGKKWHGEQCCRRRGWKGPPGLTT